ncbi:DUF433 domain-containing protein [Fodinicurvata sediminis]|uniref:DUF433 domain-containing protein n=1 Tax=Fodinicurvata sediminis TaxID=1121832 RepID=UPI00047DC9A2|nr:DUF433 domain-containing protein [Fodinicurvata sediminis]
MTRFDANTVISAFTEQQVERLTGISVHRLRRWDRTGFFRPGYGAENRRAPYSRIYSFVDVAALRVLSMLITQHNVPVRHLRQVSERLGKLDNAEWTRVQLYVMNRKVIFDDPDQGQQREVVSGQYMLPIPLAQVVSDTRRDVQQLSKRSAEQTGKIERNRYVSHNAPTIAGTRIPVAAIKAFDEDGYSVKQIKAEFPGLTEADIRAAIGYSEDAAAA